MVTIANTNRSLNLTPKGKGRKVIKKVKKEKGSRQGEIRKAMAYQT